MTTICERIKQITGHYMLNVFKFVAETIGKLAQI